VQNANLKFISAQLVVTRWVTCGIGLSSGWRSNSSIPAATHHLAALSRLCWRSVLGTSSPALIATTLASSALALGPDSSRRCSLISDLFTHSASWKDLVNKSTWKCNYLVTQWINFLHLIKPLKKIGIHPLCSTRIGPSLVSAKCSASTSSSTSLTRCSTPQLTWLGDPVSPKQLATLIL